MTLKDFLKKYPLKKLRAEMGGNSHSRRILGPIGEDKKVNVPTGITVYDDKNMLIGKQYLFFNLDNFDSYNLYSMLLILLEQKYISYV